MPNVVVCSPARIGRFVHHLLIVLIAILGVAGVASAQTTVTLSTPGTHINADQTIQGGGYALADYSNSPVLASKVSSSESYDRRILLKFDTQNYIPANAVIQSAYLYLVLKTAENSENRPFTAYHVTRSFAKDQVNWHYYKDGQAWTRPGGDLGPSFGTTYVGNAVGSAYRFDLTKMVQTAVNGQFGSRYTRIALIDTGALSDGNYREFHSTRAANASQRPRLVITYGASGTSAPATATPPPPPPPPPPTSTGTTLRVMDWNIHKTKGSDGVCNPDRIANGIAAQKVDVVSLHEVNFFSGVCAYTFDMGAKLETLLEQKTGIAWYRQNVNAGGTGNVLLSRIKPVSSSSYLLSYDRGVAQMTIVVNGRNVNLFSTHVEYYTASWRPTQITQAVNYAGTFGDPRIVMGDFNTNPGTSDYYRIANYYNDAWAVAQSAGTAWAYDGSGSTHGGSRFDYVFYSRTSLLALQNVKVPDMRVGSVYSSDHDPVVATFTVK